jgi:NAD(P)H-hydrate epimerase
MKVVSVAEMIRVEKEADSSGHTYEKMMEHAGRGLAESVRDAYRRVGVRRALGLVGSGNNGGDTLVAFAYLQEWGWQTTAYIVKARQETDPLVVRLRQAGGTILDIASDPELEMLIEALGTHPVLLDGVLGTGIHLPLRGGVGEILEMVRDRLKTMESPPYVVAVDCPSGVDCDSGEAAPACIPADMTVTMAAIKQGLLKFPAYNLVGKLKLVGIGLPEGLGAYEAVHKWVIDADWVRGVMPERPLDAHKSTFGVVMVLAGSVNYSGAVLLAGESAFRSGAGWVTLAVPEPLHAALAGSFIEATWLPLPHESGWLAEEAVRPVLNNLDRITAMLVGPGFGLKSCTEGFVEHFVRSLDQDMPHLVVDADGLKLLAGIENWSAVLPGQAVLTPHPGEMSVLTGLPVSEIQSDRMGVAAQYAQEWGHVVVLKGAFTVIASPEGDTAVIPVATPALARAGTGDVLAGLIVGLRAQGMTSFEAAAAGAWIHAQAGLHAADLVGSTAAVLAGDVLAAVPDVLAEL